MSGFKPLGPGELRLLRRLVIAPSLRQAALAQDLEVTRSAVNQLWHNLKQDRSLTIRGIIDYGAIGFRLLFGWARAGEGSNVIPKFQRWLAANPLATVAVESAISSTMDRRVYFEALLPHGERGSWFLSQLMRFQKRPYSLEFDFGFATHLANHMNLGLFDGRSWDFSVAFRLRASIDSARGYVDVLPQVSSVQQSEPSGIEFENAVVASALEENFFSTSTDLIQTYRSLKFPEPSERTLRRRLSNIRNSIAHPYASIENIGLTQTVLVLVKEMSDIPELSRLLQTQATTFPKARVVNNDSLTAMILKLPYNSDWFTMSQLFSELATPASMICTFIANDVQIWKRLTDLVRYLALRQRSD
ncbi:MAG: hypothetical protein ACFE7R_03810 [Candidatus Hodarchaeota archaeon]